MKKLLYLSIVGTMFLTSCGNDDSVAPTHEIGTWLLDSYVLTNPPAGFEGSDGIAFQVNEISFGGVAFDSYEITFAQDGTFTRRIGVSIGPNINDDGTWSITDDDIVLTSSDTETDEEYTVERNENDQLWWSTETSFALLSDFRSDSLVNAGVTSLTQEQFTQLASVVVVDLIYAFERSE